jgi:hypothetical protein
MAREREWGRGEGGKKIMCSKLDSMKRKAVTSNFKVFVWMSQKIHRKLIMTDSP